MISSSNRSFVVTSTLCIIITISNSFHLILLCFKQFFEIHRGFLVRAGSQCIVEGCALLVTSDSLQNSICLVNISVQSGMRVMLLHRVLSSGHSGRRGVDSPLRITLLLMELLPLTSSSDRHLVLRIEGPSNLLHVLRPDLRLVRVLHQLLHLEHHHTHDHDSASPQPAAPHSHDVHHTQHEADEPLPRQVAGSVPCGDLVQPAAEQRVRPTPHAPSPRAPEQSGVHTRRQERRGDGHAHQRRRVATGDGERHAHARRQRDEEAQDQVVRIPAVQHLDGGPARPDLAAGGERERRAESADEKAGEELAWRERRRRTQSRMPMTSERRDMRMSARSWMTLARGEEEKEATPKAMPRMGPISGETSMEATTMTELLPARPSAAISPAEMRRRT